ncbi:hypothetical protein BO94DRAFT_607001 [Aspergillus sclerotioniger CBS 115572]|uniref:Uncharacterized protein n=1 Tax=Aspergillus sclerotioniger CBS 115572 TaxID=1450535 RepID=A0A317VLS7_9EURO|nr:hypothetical protein BO94DRAFT_607001 [Aspergillus sclerotioniger CBS 115572]PWY74519.1 hypothetical protein BO94DRAFT_607001 [Aspergillus sclerotioniger CBS 115572]
MDDICEYDSRSSLVNAGQDNQSDDGERVASLEDASFGISLVPVGCASGYHLLNDARSPDQREMITAYDGSVYYEGKALEVIHGNLSPESNAFATLLVYEFRFTGRRPKARITWASVSFKFRNSDSNSPELKVLQFSPDHQGPLSPVEQEYESSTTLKWHAKAGISVVSGGGAYDKSNVVRCTKTKDTKVVGTPIITPFQRVYGVKWTLEENEASQAGVPDRIRTAILLERYTEDRFEATVEINMNVKNCYWMERLGGMKDQNDPILYNPSTPPTNHLGRVYDRHHLAAVDLSSFYKLSLR